MIIKGRNPTMRHVSRTRRVALHWLFDRINLDTKIQINYVDTKNQLADMLTKGSFTRDEWDHLLRLLNIMYFSIFSCSHFSDLFLIRSESRASCQKEVKRRLQVKTHQWQSRKQQFQRKRDQSTWYHAASGVRKTLHRIWGIWSIRGMPMNEREWK